MKRLSGPSGERPARNLQYFRQFGGKGATRRLLFIPPASAAIRPLLLLLQQRSAVRRGCGSGRLRSTRIRLSLGRLGRVGSQEAVFQRCPVEPANNGLHFVGRGRFHEGEALGFLSFVVSDHFNGIGYEIFRGQPLLDVIGGDPSRKVAKKYGEAHSVDYLTPLVGFAALQGRIPVGQLDGTRLPDPIAIGCHRYRGPRAGSPQWGYHVHSQVNGLKTIVPVLVCWALLLYCCWDIFRRNRPAYVSQEYNVEITVTGPDGKIIPIVGRAPKSGSTGSMARAGGGAAPLP